MRFATLFAALATAASVQAAWSDGGNLPEDHIMRAKPKVALNARKATTSKSTTAATSTVAVVDPNCTNSPTSRNCWSNGYSVATDFDAKWPTTGVTRYYTLTASNTTCSQDGSPKKQCFLWNGQFPGPTITANWGDYIQVTVQNNMKSNGTGMLQLNCLLLSSLTFCKVYIGTA
jgi:FtsP/CotA-like multicopper oxidase with cupredoxin domain